MKKLAILLIIVFCLLLITISYIGLKKIRLPKNLNHFNLLTPSPQIKKFPFCIPQDITENQQLMKAERLTIKESNEDFIVFGFLVNNPVDLNDNPSFIGIYKETPNGCESIYKFSPVLPEESATFPLLLENLWVEKERIISAWGQVGASYFGNYPLVIAYENKKFKLIPFYEGNLAELSSLKDLTWTTMDLFVKNYFYPEEEVKTILTQGVSLGEQGINLRFYADNNCHACEHEYLFLNFPLP